ncbi:MAG: ABC transporter substrate-binding protein [Lachnospiraceae bacterium]|nr:ABC transporter substrate-binding protein [Lachnospiraceae bacterium]
MIKYNVKKLIFPFLMAVMLLQGCADKDPAAKAVTGSTVEAAEEQHSEGESRSTILDEKLEKEAEKREEEEALLAEETGVAFIDDIGRNVTVESHDRVITMIGSFTDIWLLAGGEVVGAANDSWDSFELNLGADVVNIGSHVEPDIEKIIAAKPDLVIASANTDADVKMEKILTDSGITVAYFSVSNFNEYMNMLEICTDITGRKDLYAKNGTEVQKQVDAARELINQRNLEGKEAPKIVFLRASASSIKAKGSYGNVGGEMFADLGCVNVADDDNSLLDDLSMEAIIAADPDFIFVTTQGKDARAVQQNIEETLLNNPAWNNLSAVKNDRYFVLEKELYNLKPNARWGEAYQKLADILYSEETDTD